MPKICCIPTCRVRSDNLAGCKLTFHVIPAEKNLRETWERILQQKFNLVLKKYSYVCSLHFALDCFYFSGLCKNLRLKKGSCPTIFSEESNASNCIQIVHENEQSDQSDVENDLNSLNAVKLNTKSSENIEVQRDLPINEPSCNSTNDHRYSDAEMNMITESEISTDQSNEIPEITSIKVIQTSDHNSPSDSISFKKIKQSLLKRNIEHLNVSDEVKSILFDAKTEIMNLRRKNKNLRMKLYRWKKGVKNIDSLLYHIKDRKFINDKILDVIKESVPSKAYHLFKILLCNNLKTAFPPALQKFATTLHFYSPKAYNYVRETFMKCLTHPKSISKWFRKIKCPSGINEASIKAIKRKVIFEKEKNERSAVLCNLIIDEMKIKKHVEVVNSVEYGYIDIGNNANPYSVLEAENALVIMLVCINGHWKIPASYYFVQSLSGKIKADLVKQHLLEIMKTGVEITSITFDGLQTNVSMCHKLGATLLADNLKNAHFSHPVTGKPIYVIPDACHNLKLIRNCLAVCDLYDSEGNLISWVFFEHLVAYQESQGVHPGTKIRRQHIDFEQNKMNVRLAAQTFSESVSIAFRYLRDDEKINDFKNVEGTAKFCSMINEAFDILNSRVQFHKNKSKTAMCHNNIIDLTNKIESIIIYLQTLITATGVKVIYSARKTGFLGMIIALENVLRVYDTYIKPLGGYLLTYKLSQDHLETFFSAIRSKGGYSNNPTCYQFICIFKKLLVHADIKESQYANCISLDDTNILHVTSKEMPDSCTFSVNENSILQTCNKISDEEDFYGKGTNTVYINNIVSYLAGFVVRAILKKSKCFECPLLLTSDKCNSILLNKKNRQGLIKASSDVIDVCKIVEKNFRLFYVSEKAIFRKLYNSILYNISESFLPIQHSKNPAAHRLSLLKSIIFTYLRIRINYYENQKRHSTKKMRRIYTKMILFRNE